MKLFLALLLLPLLGYAQVNGELGVYSNYLWRGTTFSDNQPVVQMGASTDIGQGFYVGTFVSNATIVDPTRDKMTHEVDAIVGKVFQSGDWKLDLYYNKYFFPNAGVYDTHEYVSQLSYGRHFLRFSQMDNLFGYGSVYRYVRTGKEWSVKKDVDAGLYAGYNFFSKQKNAGNNDYFDISASIKKQLPAGYATFTANWTNRYLYSDDGHDKAKDLLFIVGYALPFEL
jgi:uncharacterized protein (TIGR02001 family)